MKWLALLICLLVMVVASAAMAQSVDIPDVVPGKLVYTIPAGFDPPLIGKSGIGEIQRAAQSLHFPYYVILVEQFDGVTDEDAANLIDTIAGRWQEDPDFRSDKSSIFLLSYGPRKYRFLAGSYWEAKLGFDAAAHAPYNAIFQSYVAKSRKDPKTGIIKMMQAVDQYLFVESDPKTIVAREEAKRKAVIANREARRKAREAAELQAIRARIQTEVGSISQLLANDRRFLPADTAEYERARDRAQASVTSNDKNLLAREAAAVRSAGADLSAFVTRRKSEAQKRAAVLAGRVGAVSVALLIVLVLVIIRARQYRKLKLEFDGLCKPWEERILNSSPKYLRFDSERESILGLSELTGRTKELYETTTREVDDIFIAIGAMQAHMDACKLIAGGASFFNPAPLRQAVAKFRGEFAFGTDQINKVSLFAPETRQVTLRASEIEGQLEERFRRAVELWDHLKKAAEIRFKPAEEVFSQNKLDEMLATADSNSIPRRWLAHHPLFGDDESDRSLYAQVNDRRMDDPAAYLERLEGMQQKESEIAERMDRLVAAINTAKSQRIDAAPDLTMTVLQPGDDPRVTFDAARREEARFTALLATRDDVAEVETQATAVRDLYRKCVEQAAMAQAAISAAQQQVEEAHQQTARVSELAQGSETLVRDREHLYSNLGGAQISLENGHRFLAAANSAIESAESLLAERRHVEAEASARLAKKQLDGAAHEFDQCRRQCEELDEAKRCFEERLAGLDDRQRDIGARIRQYGGSSRSLQRFHYTPSSSAADYLVLLNELDSVESSWDTEVRRAVRSYESAQRCQREATAEGWRAESLLSSSSGGSLDDSSSSSSGGSWGGGGDSSSSSSSSSGGSW